MRSNRQLIILTVTPLATARGDFSHSDSIVASAAARRRLSCSASAWHSAASRCAGESFPIPNSMAHERLRIDSRTFLQHGFVVRKTCSTRHEFSVDAAGDRGARRRRLLRAARTFCDGCACWTTTASQLVPFFLLRTLPCARLLILVPPCVCASQRALR